MASTRKSEQGSFYIILALSIVVLFGFIGLAVDLSRQMTIHTELQNAADACSIAAASELNGVSDSLLRAEQAGVYVGSLNLKDFQTNQVSFASEDVQFSTSASGPFQDKLSADTTSRFVKCRANSQGVINYFMGMLGIHSSNLTASSIATLLPSQAASAAPMAINSGYVTGNVVPFVFNKTGTFKGSILGTTLTVAASPQPTTFLAVGTVLTATGIPAGTKINANGTGIGMGGTYLINNPLTLGTALAPVSITATASAFLAASASDYAANPVTSNPILTMQKYGAYYPSTQVGASITVPTSSLSSLLSFEDAWNSRFGIYRAAMPSLITGTLPDLTGYSYAAYNLLDYTTTRVPSRSILQTPIINYTSPTITGFASAQVANGASNRRLVVIPIVSANVIQGWACAILLNPESSYLLNSTTTLSLSYPIASLGYIGDAASSSSPCRTFGLPGGTSGPLVPSLIQ